MKSKVKFSVVDTQEDVTLLEIYSHERASEVAADLNHQHCPKLLNEDGVYEYVDPEPERFKVVKITIESMD